MPPSLDCRRSIRISVDIQEQSRTITGYRTASKFYRRPPGPGWLAALVAIPLLLEWMGWSGLHRSAGETNVTLPSVDQTATLMTPSVSAPNLNTPTGSLPGLSFAPLSIVRSGNGFTLIGDLRPEREERIAGHLAWHFRRRRQLDGQPEHQGRCQCTGFHWTRWLVQSGGGHSGLQLRSQR